MTAAQFDVGGYRLAVEITGDSSPVVVFSSGLGDDGAPWKATIAALGPAVSTLTYARAGIGPSDGLTDRKPRSLGAAAEELQRLLAAIGEHRPCVLVGHSIGALIAVLFAARWPERLAGLVLVDSSDIHLHTRLDSQEAIIRDGDGDRDDHAWLDLGVSIPEVVAARRRLDVPVVVISSRVGHWLEVEDPAAYRPFSLAEMDDVWQQGQQELADDLGATRLVANLGGHYVQRDQPELVARAIKGIASGQ